jgi:hypothetical protein
VTASSSSDFALIIDSDLGFLMWLGELLRELGCQAVPALHCRQALALAKRFELPITILVLDPELPGAERVVHQLAAANPGVRVALIRDSAAHAGPRIAKRGIQADPDGIPARYTLERPSPWESISRPEWLENIRKMLRA